MAFTHLKNENTPIIDSHIHLYAQAHISSLNFSAELSKNHPLNTQCSVDEYKVATGSNPNVLGFVFLETDRKSGLLDGEWGDVLGEIDFLLRIARGSPEPGEGHESDDHQLVLGIVPWAPIPAGEQALSRYLDQVRRNCRDEWKLVKGFRYLVQDKTAGVMLQPQFVEGLRYLATQGLSFDLGVDARSGGIHQLREACTLMDQLYRADCHIKIIINHLCKPNLKLGAHEARAGHQDFVHWRTYVEKMASFRTTYMKLSGLFSELPEQTPGQPAKLSDLVDVIKPWIDVVFTAFGPSRIMFGSDWPVCNVGGPGPILSWTHWHDLVTALLESQSLTREEKAQVWAGTAMEAYRIPVPRTR